jgi:hypothetical protein
MSRSGTAVSRSGKLCQQQVRTKSLLTATGGVGNCYLRHTLEPLSMCVIVCCIFIVFLVVGYMLSQWFLMRFKLLSTRTKLSVIVSNDGVFHFSIVGNGVFHFSIGKKNYIMSLLLIMYLCILKWSQLIELCNCYIEVSC